MAFPPYRLPEPVRAFDPKLVVNRLYGRPIIFRELELITIDPDQDYTAAPSLKKTEPQGD